MEKAIEDLTITKFVLSLTAPVRDGHSEAEGREERDHFIIRHRAFLKQNMQHFPFIRTNSGLCVGAVQYSPVWMEVSMQLIVTLLLLEAYGLTMIEMLLTARGVVSVCGMLSFSRTDYSAGDSASGLWWQWMGFLCVFFFGQEDTRVCVSVCLIESITVRTCICVLQGSCVWFCEWREMGSLHVEPQTQTRQLSHSMSCMSSDYSASVYLQLK